MVYFQFIQSAIRSAITQQSVVAGIIELLRSGVTDPYFTSTCLHLLRFITCPTRSQPGSEPDPLISTAVEWCKTYGLHEVLDNINYGISPIEVRNEARQLAKDLFEEDEEDDEFVPQVIESRSTLGSEETRNPGVFNISAGFQGGEGVSSLPTGMGGDRGMGRGSHMLKPSWMTQN